MPKVQKVLCFPWVVLSRLFLVCIFFLFLCIIWPIFLSRYLVSVLAGIFRPDLGLILTPISRFYIPVSRTGANMIVQFKLRGEMDYTRLVDQFTERCILLRDADSGKFKFPEFQQYASTWLGYPFWKNEENFQMNHHLRHLVLESEKDIEEEYKMTVGKPFSTDKSPWEATLVEIKENPSYHYIWFKFHHLLADGDSLSNALRCAADSEPQQLQRRVDAHLSFLTQFSRAVDFITAFFCTLRRIVQPVPSPWDSRDLAPVVFRTAMESIPLSQIKGLGQKFGVSVSAILMSIVSGAIRRKFLVEGVSKPPSDMRGMSPVPLPHPLPNLMNKNLVFEFVYPIQKTELFERLTDLEMQIQRERQMKSSLALYFVTHIMWSLPLCFLIVPKHGLCNPIIIFPGPTAPVSFGGNIVEDVAFTANMNSQSPYTLLVTILSYNGKLRFNISANGKICTSQSAVEEFSGYILEELHEMDSSPPNPIVECV